MAFNNFINNHLLMKTYEPQTLSELFDIADKLDKNKYAQAIREVDGEVRYYTIYKGKK